MNQKKRVIIEDNSDVILNITIGNAQIGGSLIRWKNENTNLGKGKITHLTLGRGSVIKGKTLEILTNLVDINEQTNKLIVTYFLQNVTDPVYTLIDQFENEGAHFSFSLSITFN
jgi:hypothetical protein